MFGAGAVAVEIVAALTVVTVSGVTVGWRSAIEGTIAAVVLLAARVTVVGAPPARLIPIDTLRFAIGALLLVLVLDGCENRCFERAGTQGVGGRGRDLPRER